MRLSVLLAVVAALVPAASAEARAFRQTYGATVPTADGGCVWNINQDYFVPRHCDSCRYDLFSAARRLTPGRRLAGICTRCTRGTARRLGRAGTSGGITYKKYCGCTPLRHTYGPWHLEKCRKHALVLRKDAVCEGGCGGGACLAPDHLALACAGAGDFAGYEMFAGEGYAPNLESMEVETLGTLETVPSAGPLVMPAAASAATPSSASMAQPDPLPLGILPGPAGAVMSLPAPGAN